MPREAQLQSGDKIYVISRRDISVGYQAVQSVHAFREFVEKHREFEQQWYEQSNYLALLTVENEEELEGLLRAALRLNLKTACFREPDINDEMTAIVIEPGGKKLCRGLRLLGS